MAKNISAGTPVGKVVRIKKRMRKNLTDLNDAGSLTAGQRDLLFARVLSDLVRLKLYEMNQLGDED